VIVCPRCNKENQDHYKFCLGCGSELPRSASQAPRAFTAATPPRGVPQAPKYSGAPTVAATERNLDVGGIAGEKQMQFAKTQVKGTEPTEPPSAVPETIALGATPESLRPQETATAYIPCPTCANPVPADFKFCGTCGNKIDVSPAPAAPTAAKPAIAPAAPAPVAPAKSTAQPMPRTPAHRGALVLINPDGSEGMSFALQTDKTTIGRDTGAPFTGDVYLSPVHATFTFKGDKLFVTDQGSLNGVYIKLERQAPAAIEDGAVFRIGQEIIRFEAIPPPKDVNGVELMGSPNPGYIGRICTVIGPNTIGDAFAIAPDGMHIGRERGEITFPDDGYVSGLHCRVNKEGDRVLLTDVGSSNGTFLRIRGEREIRNGELVLLGQQLFCARF
jgi:pSer/pThr/pTyr-binding forkhead associated (FHA) protein